MSGLNVDTTTVSRLIGSIDEAAGDARLRPAFLSYLTKVIEGKTTVLIIEDLATRRATLVGASGVDLSYQREYEGHYAATNPYDNDVVRDIFSKAS